MILVILVLKYAHKLFSINFNAIIKTYINYNASIKVYLNHNSSKVYINYH